MGTNQGEDIFFQNREACNKYIDAVPDETFDAAYDDRLTEDLKNICCICGEEYEGYGNNPAPVSEEGRCCNACNLKFVIPARIELL